MDITAFTISVTRRESVARSLFHPLPTDVGLQLLSSDLGPGCAGVLVDDVIAGRLDAATLDDCFDLARTLRYVPTILDRVLPSEEISS